VQVGDPFTEKLLLEACLEAFRTGAVVGIQDMGAAGLACSLSEDDPAEAVRTGKALVAYYLGTEPHIMEASGAEPELITKVQEVVGWPATEADYRRAADLIPDSLVRSLMAVGSGAECRTKVAEFIDAGVTCPILYPVMDDVASVVDAFTGWST